MPTYIRPPGGQATVVVPTLFSTANAVDTWYVGRISDPDTFAGTTEILGLTLTSEIDGVSNRYRGIEVTGPGNLKGLRGPQNSTGSLASLSFGVDNLADTSYDLTNTDSFSFVYQTKFSSAPDSFGAGYIVDWGTNGVSVAGFCVHYTNTQVDFYVEDDSGNFHTTRFTYPVGFTPWQDDVFYTWIWRFNKANNYGTLTTKAEGEAAVDRSANCSNPGGPNFSALGAITFSGKSMPLFIGSYYTSNPVSIPLDFYQFAFAKNITYDPGTLP